MPIFKQRARKEGIVDGETESSSGLEGVRFAVASTGHIIANCPTQVPKPAEATTSAEPPKTFDLPAIDSYVADQVREQGYAGSIAGDRPRWQGCPGQGLWQATGSRRCTG